MVQQTVTAGIFTIKYTLFTNAAPGADIQFGMDFQITQASTASQLPLSQLIFPATSVGNNTAGQWNIDNHMPASTDPECLIFANANGGIIADTPREISRRDKGVLNTKFTVYRVNVDTAVLQISGVKFGYSINTSDATPVTTFTGFNQWQISNEEKQLVLAQCSTIKFN